MEPPEAHWSGGLSPSALRELVFILHIPLHSLDIGKRQRRGRESTVKRAKGNREGAMGKVKGELEKIKSSRCRIRDLRRPRHRKSPTAHHSRIGPPCTRTTRSQSSGTMPLGATHSNLFHIPQQTQQTHKQQKQPRSNQRSSNKNHQSSITKTKGKGGGEEKGRGKGP